MAAEEWSMLRVRRSTRAKLYEFIMRLERAYEQLKFIPGHRHDVLITVDDAIVELLRREEEKARRKRESRERKKAEQKPPDA